MVCSVLREHVYCPPGEEKQLISLMEGVEDIPGTVLYEGICRWETFPRYIDCLGSTILSLLDVQSDLLSGLNTRVVVPLLPRTDAPIPAQRLNPVFEIENVEVLMATQFLAAVPEPELKETVGNLKGTQTKSPLHWICYFRLFRNGILALDPSLGKASSLTSLLNSSTYLDG
jgi:toxin CcdB